MISAASSSTRTQPPVRAATAWLIVASEAPLASKEVYVIANMPIPPKEGHTSGPQMRGKVRKVLIDQNAFILTDTASNERRFQLAESGKVFANNIEGKLENLKPGDDIYVYSGKGTFHYVVRTTKIVLPTTIQVMAPTTDARLTLITCTPVKIASHRLIVIADLDPNYTAPARGR